MATACSSIIPGTMRAAIAWIAWRVAVRARSMPSPEKARPTRSAALAGALYTSAGVTAGIDLSLYLLGRDHGAELALKVAERLVVFTQRAGGQSQFSPFLTT